MWDIINKKHKSLPYKINKIINELKEDIKSIQQNDKPKKDVMPISYKSKNDVYNNKDEWTYEKHLAFLEGFDSGGSWQGNKSSNFLSRNNEKEDWKKKLNIGNPETDEGHWVTLKNHQHVFIKDA